MVFIIKYSSENPAERGKLNMAREGDEIILLQNGVFWAIDTAIDPYLEKGLSFFALEDDLLARGYRTDDSKVPTITYDGLIEIVERQEQSVG